MGCSSNPENVENDTNNNRNNKNDNNQITEQTLTKVNNSCPEEPPNPLLSSKATNLQKSSESLFKKPNPKKKLSPISISSIKIDESKSIYLIKIKACYFFKEELIPIWFEKDTYIKFITTGKWRIDEKYNFTDSRGMPSNHNSGFNYGAAVARIGSGPNFLLAPNDFTYFTNNEGPLYLRMNLPKNITMNPEGTMDIKVFDGTLMTIDEINSKLGWKEKNMDYSNEKSTELENGLTKDLNNLRMNPVLFYEKYIRNKCNIIWTEDFLKLMKNNNNDNQISAFSTNNDLYNCLKKYVRKNSSEIKTNLTSKRGVDKYMEKNKEKIAVYLKQIFGSEILVDFRRTKKYDTDDLCMMYILDINFRKNIFSSEYYSIAVNILEDILPDEIFIILVFMKD